MAHVTKFTRKSVPGIATHIERKTAHHSNKDIDINKSHLNYSMLNDNLDMNQRLKNRLENVKVLARDDVKVLCSWVITLPNELIHKTDDEIKLFFKSSHEFLSDRYGSKNIIASEVHVDETTPHLHFGFVPVVIDKKNHKEKVSAKDVLTRKELNEFHKALDEHLKNDIGHIYQEGILNGKTLNLSSTEQIKLHDSIIKQARNELEKANMELEKVNLEYLAKKEYVNQVSQANINQSLPPDAVIKKNILSKKETVTVSKEQWDKHVLSSKEQEILQSTKKTIDQVIKKLETTDIARELQEKIKENDDLKKQIETIEERYKENKKTLDEAVKLMKDTTPSLKMYHTLQNLHNDIAKPILQKYNDKLQFIISKIVKPINENLGDFLKGYLAATLQDMSFNQTIDIAKESYRYGFETIKDLEQLYEFTKELEVNEEQKHMQVL